MSQESLLELWPPTWDYDFVYLPYSMKQRRSVSYACINFVSNQAAQLFYSNWEGRQLTVKCITKTLSVRPAGMQGVLLNIRHLQSRGIEDVHNNYHLPALFYGTSRLSFREVLGQVKRQSVLQ